ncbi:MAG TPA: PIN domain-containing protein [Eoetvoesiella sp.]|uniref:PIN domain-containing protein n=1 Tax=Eoetvoesiella sp. TaxID=1966355 RepID=UPI002BC99996|nr:PIN domain-containing protein [Eoetvoesiella sp.]HWK62433.1 PIN domain-containing protein [Eoetvoesiella sp.]
MSGLPDILVIDTCVLISNVLRRLLLRLAGHGCFQPAWSPVIGDEWRRNASRVWGVPIADLEVQWEALQAAFPMADQGDIAAFKEGLKRSDPKDWHVIAAALAAQARHPGRAVAVVTRNTRDFNRSELRQRGLQLFDPDQLLLRCWESAPELVRSQCTLIADDALQAGREAEALDSVLRRERLFRFNRVLDAQPVPP